MTLKAEPDGWYLGSRSPLGSGFLVGFAASAVFSLAAAPEPAVVARASAHRSATAEGAWKRANLAKRSGNPQEALRHYTEALDLAKSDKRRGPLHFERGRLLADMGENRRAILDFDRAAELGHAVGQSHYLAAAAHARDGRAEEAVNRLRRATDAGWRRYQDLSRDFARISKDPRYRSFLRGLER